MTGEHAVREATADDVRASRAARASWHAAYDDVFGRGAVEERLDSWFDPDRLLADDVGVDDGPLFVAGSDEVVGFVEVSSGRTNRRTRIGSPSFPTAGGRSGSRLLERAERATRERGSRDGGGRLRLSVLAASVPGGSTRGFERTGEGQKDGLGGEHLAYEERVR